MNRIQRAIATARENAPTNRPPGVLVPLGWWQIGAGPGREELSMCLDCETTFPHLGGGPPSCNGHRIGRCPWCAPESDPHGVVRGDHLGLARKTATA